MKLQNFSAKQDRFHRAKVRAIAAEFGHPRPSDEQVAKVLDCLDEIDLGAHPLRPNYRIVCDPVVAIRDHYRSVAGLRPLKPRPVGEVLQRLIEEVWLD